MLTRVAPWARTPGEEGLEAGVGGSLMRTSIPLSLLTADPG